MTDNVLPPSIAGALPSAADVVTAVGRLVQLVDDLASEAEYSAKVDIATTARVFVLLHRLSDLFDGLHRGKDRLGKFGALFEKFKKTVVPTALEAAGVNFVPLSEGYRVGVNHMTFVSIKEGQRDSAYDWLRGNGLSNLITSTVNSSSLSAAVRHMIEEENRQPPSELFAVTPVVNTSVTATK